MKPSEKTCCICGRELTSRQKATCSRSCRSEFVSLKMKGRPSKRRKYYTICCAVCGKTVIQTAKESRRGGNKTCSPECHKKYRQLKCGKTGTLPPTTETIAKRLAHDTCRSCPDQASSKEYSLMDPSGNVYRGRNIAYFVKSHFPESEWKKATDGLAHLRPWRTQSRHSWHDWTWAE